MVVLTLDFFAMYLHWKTSRDLKTLHGPLGNMRKKFLLSRWWDYISYIMLYCTFDLSLPLSLHTGGAEEAFYCEEEELELESASKY